MTDMNTILHALASAKALLTPMTNRIKNIDCKDAEYILANIDKALECAIWKDVV